MSKDLSAGPARLRPWPPRQKNSIAGGSNWSSAHGGNGGTSPADSLPENARPEKGEPPLLPPLPPL
eukprot:11172708-Lingulodinium_polyedra.AAC.1